MKNRAVSRIFAVLVALLLLNLSLNFESIWPTIWVKPTLYLAPEFLELLALLGLVAALGMRWSGRAIKFLAAVYLLLIVGHYADMVVPNLLGRPVNFYWDIPRIPRFLWVSAQGSPWWVSVGAVVGFIAVTWGAYRLLAWAIGTVAYAITPVSRKPLLWGVLLPVIGLMYTNVLGVNTPWQVFCKPVIPTYAKEVVRFAQMVNPQSVVNMLPAHTVINDAMKEPAGQVMAGLHHKDVMLMFLESYGAMVFDQPDVVAAVEKTREKWAESIKNSGRHVVSAFYTSPTIGGGSELAQMSLLSGIDLEVSNPRRLEILLTTNKPTLISVFQRAGYQTFGLYHSVFWNWIEHKFYGYDHYVDGPALGYKGPAFGFWKIPDQYALPRFNQLYPIKADSPPRFIVFPTISTHFPFCHVPPYQPDEKRLLGPHPFDDADVKRAQAEQVQWQGSFKPDFLRTVNYMHTWLAGYFAKPPKRDMVYVMLGDHQPVGSVSGEGATWDVPVFIVSTDQTLLDRFRAMGFTDGLKPAHRKSLGKLSDLTTVLLKGFGPNPPAVNH